MKLCNIVYNQSFTRSLTCDNLDCTLFWAKKKFIDDDYISCIKNTKTKKEKTI